ncbi:ABC transporter ATP-binding protein [Salinifilum ghardaiensis]
MIEASGLTKRYGDKTVVRDLSFTVRPGRVTGFLGPNGAGKSTTMRMILGLDRPTAGDVRVDGEHYRDLKHPLRTIGALLDAKWVHPNRSARTHLRWLARSNRIPNSRVETVLEQVGLSEVADRRAGGFSLGMSQRLGIAGALLGDPGILMFDEPVNGLDPEGIHWIRRFMQGLAAEGRTVLVSSHLLSEMAQTAEELVVIGRGELLAQCPTEEFVNQAGAQGVVVRSPQVDRLAAALRSAGIAAQSTGDSALEVRGASTDQVGEIAAQQGCVVHELATRSGSLEDAFMRMTSEAVEYSSTEEPTGASALSGVK